MAAKVLEKQDEFISMAEEISGVKILIKRVNEIFSDGLDADTMKTLAEAIVNKTDAFVLLASEQEGKQLRTTWLKTKTPLTMPKML